MKKRLLWLLAALTLTGVVAWQLLSSPTPEEILARIDVPPAPVLSPEEALASFRTAPGFRVELVAAEPLVVDPVAMDWDDAGRLYVVEMRGYMPDIAGRGEEQPVGRIVCLEDTDADGRMDRSEVFLDALVMPRAVAVLPEGVLIGVPPDLLLCDFERPCTKPRRVGPYAVDGGVEHTENRLLPGLDGWLYNAKSTRRLRLRGDEVESQPTLFRGQWGIDQDDDGRLYHNHNSGWLYVDTFPGDYTMRQPALAARLEKPGLNVNLASREKVFGVRVAPGLNRAYQPNALRPDGRQSAATGVSGLAVQRGLQFGAAYLGDVFVPEAAGAAVGHFRIEVDGLEVRATHELYPDADHGEREFLASTDERFRPVDARIGPDGALWLIDMYRGVVQHADFVSDYLRDYVERQGLEAPGATGRIWRVVRNDRPITYAPPPLERIDDLIAALDLPSGWARDRAQRRLIALRDARVAPRLRALERFGARGRQAALRILAATNALDVQTLDAALADPDPAVRSAALGAGEALLAEAPAAFLEAAQRLADDPDAAVRLQSLHALGALPAEKRPLETLLAEGRKGDALRRQAALSGLAGLERAALTRELAHRPPASDWLRELAMADAFASQRDPEAAAALLEIVAQQPEAIAETLLAGIGEAQILPGNQRVLLTSPHPVFEDEALARAVASVRRGFTWPGDPTPGGARALSEAEETRRAAGEALYAQTCATCHGAHGRGIAGLAPPLVRSSWVRDADDWLVRIALHGVHGPIQVQGEVWDLGMPGHGDDPRFDDPGLAGLLTFLRRAWGHADAPVAPETVARIRSASAEPRGPFTAEELLALPVAHRLDRFTGAYEVPLVGLQLILERHGPGLTLGQQRGGPRTGLEELADGIFTGEGLTLRFDPTETGPAQGADVSFGGNAFPVSRVE